MDIESIKYTILSRGQDQPEPLPQPGETHELLVQKTERDIAKSPYPIPAGPEETAKVTIEHIYRINNYVETRGVASTNEAQDLACQANYATDAFYPAKTPIGELVIYRAH